MSIEFVEKIVAYVDVLGFSALVNNGDHEDLKRYFEAADRHIAELKTFKADIKTLQISDSIIITVHPDEDSLRGLISVISALQATLFDIGLLTRGSITVGEINSDIESGRIVGKAFIRAYELEKLAKFPRVLIDPKILARFEWTRGEFLELFNRETIGQLIHNVSNSRRFLRDDDLFVSYLSYSLWVTVRSHKDGEHNPHLDKIHEYYSFLRSKIYEDYSIAPKYRWIRDYILDMFVALEIERSYQGKPYADPGVPRVGGAYDHQMLATEYNKFLDL